MCVSVPVTQTEALRSRDARSLAQVYPAGSQTQVCLTSKTSNPLEHVAHGEDVLFSGVFL